MLKAQGRAAAAEAIPANGATTPTNSSTIAPSAPLLSHATRSALNNVNAKLKDARRCHGLRHPNVHSRSVPPVMA
eukprot:scaffold88632_cov30-Tisochrysis_lutea.AAC.5